MYRTIPATRHRFVAGRASSVALLLYAPTGRLRLASKISVPRLARSSLRSSHKFCSSPAGARAAGLYANKTPPSGKEKYGLETNLRREAFHYDRMFRIGDTAEYDSYNLIYLGVIVAIGPKTVTIEEYGRKHRLSIFEFSLRNRHLDLERTAQLNQAAIDYI